MLCLPPHRQTFAAPVSHSLTFHHLQPVESSSFPNIIFSGLNKCRLSGNEKSRRYGQRVYRSVSLREAEEEESGEGGSGIDRMVMFEEAVKLFNEREYYACHDLLESLWFESNDPVRTLFHGILQCAVAFYHLFNQNHKGAMMEMGEGLCKLRKLNLQGGPFQKFEQEISIVLDFIYQTQLELASCNGDFCLTMEQNERSYKLLAGFGAGQHLYFLEQSIDGQQNDITYLVFDPQTSYGATDLPFTRVKLPVLEATMNHLIACENQQGYFIQ